MRRALVALCLVLIAACRVDVPLEGDPDAREIPADATFAVDGGPGEDAGGGPGADARAGDVDSGAGGVDSGAGGVDSGAGVDDAGALDRD